LIFCIEFLYYLLKGLHEEVNLVKKKPSPIKFDEKAWDRMSEHEKAEEHWSLNLRTDHSRISEMFVGQLKSTLKCTKCDYKSPTFELFWHLAVPIPTRLNNISLEDCLKQFMLEEILDGENKPVKIIFFLNFFQKFYKLNFFFLN
jgi:ubiquitin C-terminal hydrolase